MLNVQGISLTLNQTKILDSLSFCAPKGQIIALLGASGSGKSTLLHCIARLTPLSKGEIFYDTLPLDQIAPHKIGMVFQAFHLFPHMTVEQNITYAPVKLGILSKKEAETSSRRLLTEFGMLEKGNLPPHHLSGGQKQRVAIIRSLIMMPDIILFDEPTSALDPETAQETGRLISSIKSPHHLIIIATHDLRVCQLIADHILFLDQGKLIENTSKEDFFKTPKTDRAKIFLDKAL